MKIHSILTLVVASAAILVACSASTPEATVVQMYRAVEKGDDDAALKLLNPTAIQMLGVSKMRARFAGVRKQYEACGGINSVETKSSGTAEHKEVAATVTFHGKCAPRTENIPLSRVDGKWLIGM